MPQEQSGGAVVIVPIVGPTKALLIEEFTKPRPRYFKFVSERFESGDSVLTALMRGVGQEAGLKNLHVQLDNENKQVVSIIDRRVRWYGELAPPQCVETPANPPEYPNPRSHTQYFWALRMDDHVIDSLSGQFLVTAGEKERLRTQSFKLKHLHEINILPQHRALIQKLREPQVA